jgi:hypothetical protein
MMIDAEMYGMIPSANTVKRERSTREHVEQIENAALLAREQLLQLRWIDARNGICAPMRYTTSASNRNQTTTQVAEFSSLCNLSCASSHGCLLSEL